MPDKPKIAIIGIGRWGKILLKNFEKIADVKMVASSGEIENLAWLKENYPKIKHTTNLDEIANERKIQAVVIATPIATLFEIARKMLAAGKHVFLEKPGGENSKQIATLGKEAGKKNLILQIGYEFIYAPELANIIEKTIDKKITQIKFVWNKMGSFHAHPIINLLVHELSIAKMLVPDPIKITKYSEKKGAYNPDSIHVEAKSGGVKIFFDINRVSEKKEKTVTMETDGENFEWKNDNPDIVTEEACEFLSSIRTDKQPKADTKFAKEILEIIETIPAHF